MGKYNGAVVTTAGQNLIAQAIAGGDTVTWTTAEASSYAYPSTTDFQSLTSLQNVEQTADITGAGVYSDTIIQVTTRFDNNGVEEAFLINTIGVYARINESAPVLVAVVTAVTPDQMPVEDQLSPSSFIYNVQMTVQNANSVAVTVNPAGTVNVSQLDDYVEKAGGESGATIVSFTDSDLDSGITSFPTFLSKIISGIPLARFMRDFVAGMQYVLHVGSLQNNGTTTEAGKYALDAAYGKTLTDQIASQNESFLHRRATDITYPPTGSALGDSFRAYPNAMSVGNQNIPAHTEGIIISSNSQDGILIGVDSASNIYTAFRNNGSWTKGAIHVPFNLTNINFSTSVAAKTTTVVSSITLGAGTWMIFDYMYLSNGGSGIYNNTLGERTIRSPESGGGGSINVVFDTGNKTIQAKAYVSTAQTVIGWIHAIKIG